MEKVRVAINGFGRIGRLVCRLAQEDSQLSIVAVNDLLEVDQAAYLLKYDSIHGQLPGVIERIDDQHLKVGDQSILFQKIKNPLELPWKSLSVDVVVESTGLFLTQELAGQHLTAGAKKVVLSAPAKGEMPTFVMGVNHERYQGESIVSNASCTTNCLAPLAKVVHRKFKIVEGLMSTIHAATASQAVVDSARPKDWRLGRTCGANIIPTSTGAAKAVGKVYPELLGKLTGMAFRVPVFDGSVVDLTCRVETPTSYQEICQELQRASDEEMKGILRVAKEPTVSSDIVGETHTSIVDPFAGLELNQNFFKLIAWYDNEVGYSHKLLELVKWIHAH